MHRIVLNRNITDLLEDVDPPDDLVEYVLQYNSLSTLASVFPSFLDTGLLGLFGKCVQVCEDVEFIGTTEIYIAPILIV